MSKPAEASDNESVNIDKIVKEYEDKIDKCNQEAKEKSKILQNLQKVCTFRFTLLTIENQRKGVRN